MTPKSKEAVPSSVEPAEKSPQVRPPTEGSNRGFLVHDRLESIDPATYKIIEFEEERQNRKLILIASESICPRPVKEAISSSFTNIYAEGYPALRMSRDEQELLLDFHHMLAHHRRYADRRYYKGCDFANFVEALAQRRAAELFATDGIDGVGPKVSPSEIFANVQPLSGAAANNAVYDAFLSPGDTILGLNLSHGGHLTHGSPANRSGRLFKAVAYGLDPKTERLDYDAILRQAEQARPRLIVAGFSAYPLRIDWAALREIADSVDAILLADISHPAGLVAARCFPSPIGYADVVSLTTHKTLCGPRGAIILTTDDEHAKRIDRSVFPGEQGGPHINSIAGKAVAFRIARSDSFRALQRATLENAKSLATAFQDEGLKVCCHGTESHLCLLDLKPIHPDSEVKLSGEIASRILDLAGITCNKNTIPGDTNAAHPSALRFGTTFVTQRGLVPADMAVIAKIVARLLTNIHPFSYLHRKAIGRGKIELEILNECRGEVAALVEKAAYDTVLERHRGYPHDFPVAPKRQADSSTMARDTDNDGMHYVERSGKRMVYAYGEVDEEVRAAKEGAVLFDLSDHRLLEVSGWRASLFLHEMCAGDILSLGVGETRESAVLDRHGMVRDIVRVLRRTPDDNERDRYFVLSGPEQSEWIRDWFRAVSDGYVLFDDDCERKVQGPVVVKDRTYWQGSLDSIHLLRADGPKIAERIVSLHPSLKDLERGQSKVLTEVRVTVLRSHDGSYDFFCSEESANLIIESLKRSKVTLAGVGARDRCYANSFPRSGIKMAQERPELFLSTKPYSIGKAKCTRQEANTAEAAPASRGTTAKRQWTWEPREQDPIPSCLFDEHLKSTRATYMVPFAGWKMPLQYRSIGEEHEVVRKTAGLFDVSHMGILGFKGEHAARFLDLITANYVHWLRDGQAQYSYLFAPDGHVLDDILVYRRSAENYMMVVNAANTNKIKSWIAAVASREVAIDPEDPTVAVDIECEITCIKTEGPEEDRLVDLALQGPNSWEILRAVGGDDQAVRIQGLRRFDFIEGAIGEYPAIISRTGYTGEEVGYELYVRPSHAPAIWRLLLELGAPSSIQPVGLGARDSTRAEAGLPLYGHELGGELDLIPSEVGYGSFVKVHKPFFIGRKAYLERLRSSKRRVIRFKIKSSSSRRIKPQDPIVDSRGQSIGVVTSSVLVQGFQQGLACIEAKSIKKDATVFIFPLPEGDRASKVLPPAELKTAKVGSRSILPVEAVVLSRFPKGQRRLPKITARRNRNGNGNGNPSR